MAKDPEKVSFRERTRQLWVAFTFTRKHDKLLVPLLLIAFLIPIAAAVGLWLFAHTQWFFTLPLGVLLGVLLALILFGRRVAKATYAEVEGQPGAAAAILENIRGNWRLTPAIAVTPQQDVVHRVVGRPGVILVIEGSTQRLKNLIAQEKKRVARIAPEVPIYELAVGNEADQVPIRKLQARLLKLPRNITPKQVATLEKRLQALGTRPPIPKGPMPKGARVPKMKMQRR